MVFARDRERDLPRISVNKLGEYMVAPAGRRRSIIDEQRRPRDFVVARYTSAQDAITRFLISGRTNERIVLDEVERLRSAVARSEWEEERNQNCAEALGAFLNVADELDVGDMVAETGHANPPQLEIGSVSVSVRPEVILRGRDRNGDELVGAVKLYISKNVPLGDEAGAYVATVVQQFLTEFHEKEGRVERSRCIVVDVFAGEVHVAPRSYRRRRTDIEAACEEINRAW